MDPATDKYHVVGVGCASAVPLIRLVVPSLEATIPARRAVIVAAESDERPAEPGDRPTITAPRPSARRSSATAARQRVIEHGTTGPAIVASKVHQIEATLGACAWSCRMRTATCTSTATSRMSPRPGCRRSGRRIPRAAAALTRADVDHWIVHPGGRRILDCVRDALGSRPSELEISYDVLATRGNVGTPSIFYVLKETIAQRARSRASGA